MASIITGNVIVFGLDLPILEFLLILNIIMLIYVIISMLEIRSLIKLRKDLEEMIKRSKTPEKIEYITRRPTYPESTSQQPKIEETRREGMY